MGEPGGEGKVDLDSLLGEGEGHKPLPCLEKGWCVEHSWEEGRRGIGDPVAAGCGCGGGGEKSCARSLKGWRGGYCLVGRLQC